MTIRGATVRQFTPTWRTASISVVSLFPRRVHAASALARQTQLAILNAIGGVLVVGLTVFQAIGALRTLRGARDRSLFLAPCLVSDVLAADIEAGSV
ncbi:hypothetical protein P7D22_14415 [Lichenihabitans sp. Uapishka_5]|uniref:hypothetical protein n=1 Tax=Lichenihabitans sp. Uapishka_5 TaxID=3037302 RepID=UPI0029E7E836|nr:hypothetical protein [Lichenihabitans sp. Uapishka_5]MDX7952361.1 hypothetical protein [Lichenihabitans sp. Uapishka_5]